MEAMSTRTMAMESRREYARLLSQTLPSVVHTEKQHDVYREQLEALLQREHALTAAERELMSLLTLLIEDFEDKHSLLPRATPIEILEFLMDQHGLKQKDLVDVFGTPSVVSEILSGKRELNKDHIQRLSKRFHVSPEIFFH
jgi:HTH-type transcriptional regulator / antitoxin HigA